MVDTGGGHAGENTLGLSLIFDTNFVSDPALASQHLERLYLEGWIALARSDVVDTELGGASEAKRSGLLSESRRFSEHLGPSIWDHSRWDASLHASQSDRDLLERVYALIHPGRDLGDARKNDIRDAMHVGWAIRYGADAFVTRDKKVLRAAPSVKKAFRGFGIWTPEKALAVALARKERQEFLGRGDPPGGTF